MRFHEESRRDAYDVVVVGSGIGGLTAAALLAKAGRSVLVVERHDRPGGYAHAFKRRGRVFDSAVHLIGGCEPSRLEGGGLIHRVLGAVGARERCDFVRVDPFYTAIYPGTRVEVPAGLDAFVEAHARRFPQAEASLRRLLAVCLDVRDEVRRAAALGSPFDVMRTPDSFPLLLRYRRATAARVLDEELAEPELRALVASCWPYVGLPPSRVSFVYWATMLTTYVAEGAYYCRGSFQTFADALASAVEQHGGEVVLRSPVRRIGVEGGRVCNVVLENGQQIAARAVVSNADVRQTMTELVGEAELPARYVRTLAKMQPSTSAFVVYAATDLDLPALGFGHETFVYGSWSHDEAWAAATSGLPPDWLSLTVPTTEDASLAPRGEHLVILTTLVPYAGVASWKAAKDRFADRVIARAESVCPGLRRHLTFAEAATPRTMERYTRNSAGAIYGWSLTPSQTGVGRIGHETPVAGLYLAGHWTQPGGGIYGVVRSGIDAARAALGGVGEDELWSVLDADPEAALGRPA